MNAVENKMNTELNNEMNNEVNTPVVAKEAKKRVIKKKVLVEEVSVMPEVIATAVMPEVIATAVASPIEEDDEIEYLRRQQETIARQIKMKENAKKLKTNIKDMKQVLIENRKQKIQNLKNKMIDISNELKKALTELSFEVNKQEEELSALCDLQDCELIETITGNNDLENELGLNVKVAKKVVKETPNGEIKAKRRPKHYDRRSQFIELPSGLELTISYKEKSATYIRTAKGVERNGITYKSLMEAGRAFYKETGRDKQTFNAWAEFKVMENGKKISIGDV